MKKIILLGLVSTFILTSCWWSDDTVKTKDKFEFWMWPAPFENVNSSSWQNPTLISSWMNINKWSGAADVSTDDSLKEIDDIINSISDDK